MHVMTVKLAGKLKANRVINQCLWQSNVTRILFLFLQFVQDVKHPAFSDVFSMYRHLLTDKSTSLVFKVKKKPHLFLYFS